MALKVGFVGAGMMAEALAGGFDKAGVAAFSDMSCIDPNQSRMDLFGSWGVTACKDNAEVAKRSNVIFIAVKPYTVSQVLTEMRAAGALSKDTLVISIAAGVTLQTLEEAAGPGIPVMRVMPNTPCLVGCVAAAMSAGRGVHRVQSLHPLIVIATCIRLPRVLGTVVYTYVVVVYAHTVRHWSVVDLK